MGQLAGREIQSQSPSFFAEIDLLIPVPLAKEKLKKRGYNQCDFIAAGISDITGIEVGKEYIVRTVANETQTHKNSIERWENVKGIFKACHEEDLKGKHVLLIDDVLTTGATLISCASAIGHIEKIRISFLTMACIRQT